MGALKTAVLAGGACIVGREVLRRLQPAELRGQVALVTGGSRGLGLLIARELADAGCRLAISARDEPELQRARADLERRGAAVETIVADVGQRDQAERMVRQATQRFGRVDLLVNNAGIIQVGPLEATTLDDFQQAMDVMYWGVVYPTLAVLPQMQARQSGRIVNVTSIGGKVSVPHLLPYSCAKFAAVGFSEGLTAEVAKDGITVTTIVPGLMRTGSHLHAIFKGQQEAEYGLFSPLASMPLVSMDAERAARQVVEAIRRGESEWFLGITATLATRFHGLFPGTTVELLGLVNRFLPRARPDQTASAPGHQIHARLDSRLLDAATTLGQRAAERFNETHPTAPEQEMTSPSR
jgi:short-subunit dehydrogenase